MPRARPRLAKLTRPRLHGAVPRERLFALLDEANQRPLVWVSGPPGAGKTTLVASWLEARGIPGIWYQVDADDANPASVLHFLALAPAQTVDLPRVGGAALPDLEGFARQFFRALFATLPDGAAIVFDNCQDAGPDDAFDRLLALAIGELPDGYHLIAISRMALGAAYARLVAREAIAFIGWSSLRLTEAETRASKLSLRRQGDDDPCAIRRCSRA